MSHIDPDRLAIEALEGPVSDAEDAAHLVSCAQCHDDLVTFGRTVRAGRIALVIMIPRPVGIAMSSPMPTSPPTDSARCGG